MTYELLTGASPFTVEGERNTQSEVSRWVLFIYYQGNQSDEFNNLYILPYQTKVTWLKKWLSTPLCFSWCQKRILSPINGVLCNFKSDDFICFCRRILKASPPIPKSFSSEAKDFILKLLTKDPHERLGSRGAAEVKKHKFFKVQTCLVIDYWIQCAKGNILPIALKK